MPKKTDRSKKAPESGELAEYRRKRDFEKTPEPEGKARTSSKKRSFVIQKHAASRLHYDFRLELNGVLKSWAVPKGPSLDPAQKRLAVHVEDHPLEYGSFEGVIPHDEYGGGTVMVWDTGEWEPVEDPDKGYEKGHLKFQLHGRRLSGLWTLARMKPKPDEDRENWLLIKHKDDEARSDPDDAFLKENTTSVLTDRAMDRIAIDLDAVWESGREKKTVKAEPREGRPPKEDIDPSALTNARRKVQPEKIKPQLATLAARPPKGENWLHEIKFDGYRGICVVENHKVRIFSRNGKDWTKKFTAIAEAVEALPVANAILDGEVVALQPDGTTDFQKLQNALKGIQDASLVYYVFDLPYCLGYDLTDTPLEERKELLQRLIASAGETKRLRYSDHIKGNSETVFQHACRYALEGIISKRADSSYLRKRSRNWLKAKCLNRQEFVIGGYTDPKGQRGYFGALLVGFHDREKNLVYAGRVGAGFNEQTLADLHERLTALDRETPPFHNPPTGRERRGVHWVRPELVAEVEFSDWTDDNILRHASFEGLREDKAPEEIVRETPKIAPQETSNHSETPMRKTETPPRATSTSRENTIAGVALSHPDKVLFPEQGISKLRLARYYEEVARWALPHMTERPLSIVRCPEGRGKECFYQKHVTDSLPPSIKGIPIREKEAEREYLYITDLSGLIALVQLGALEIHPWGCKVDRVERPDLMTFDLDPGPGVEWKSVVETAHLLRERLDGLGLQSFVKTTGGKGLHVAVPLTRRSEWDDVRSFTEAFTRAVARDFPQKYLATMTKSKRQGKIFIDYFRNNRGRDQRGRLFHPRKAGSAGVRSGNLGRTGRQTPAQRLHHRKPSATVEKTEKRSLEGFFETRQSITVAMREKVGLKT